MFIHAFSQSTPGVFKSAKSTATKIAKVIELDDGKIYRKALFQFDGKNHGFL